MARQSYLRIAVGCDSGYVCGVDMKAMPTQERLRELLAYDETTGVFMWSKRRLGIKTGVPLGCDNGNGYLRITVDGVSQYAHRLAWVYMNGSLESEIDHINGVKSDNRICNLRAVLSYQNQQNKRTATSRNKSGLLGVSWHKKANKWQSHIATQGKHTYLGLFETKESAHEAYINAKRSMHQFSTI